MLNDQPKELKYRAYDFSIEIIRFVSDMPHSRVYWILGDQVLRSGTSIGANIIEAQSGSSRKDFKRYFEIALKSANETVYWLSLLRDCTNYDPEKVIFLLEEAKSLSNILGASVLTLKRY